MISELSKKKGKLSNKLVGGATSRVYDENMLKSAVNSPISQQHYRQENNPARLAAAPSYKLIKNHAFANENKRTALLAANLFLLQNGRVLKQDPYQVESNDVITKAHLDVAMGKVEESELAEVYRGLWQTATAGNTTQASRLYEA